MALHTAQSTVWGVCCMVYSLHCMFTAHWSSVNTVQSLYEKRAVELCDRWRIRSAYHKYGDNHGDDHKYDDNHGDDHEYDYNHDDDHDGHDVDGEAGGNESERLQRSKTYV